MQTDGTLVRTRPGLWSLMCSSAAAMSISLTPVNTKQDIVGDVNGKSLLRTIKTEPAGESSPFAMRFSTMSIRMYVPVLLVPSLWEEQKQVRFCRWVLQLEKSDSCQTCISLPAVNNDWAGTTPVAFIHLSEEHDRKKKKTSLCKTLQLQLNMFLRPLQKAEGCSK